MFIITSSIKRRWPKHNVTIHAGRNGFHDLPDQVRKDIDADGSMSLEEVELKEAAPPARAPTPTPVADEAASKASAEATKSDAEALVRAAVGRGRS